MGVEDLVVQETVESVDVSDEPRGFWNDLREYIGIVREQGLIYMNPGVAHNGETIYANKRFIF